MDGILIVNKPKEYTSHDIVAKVKKIAHEKVGHTGTLDPMATGVLPLLLGQGTKLSKYLIDHDKVYEATIQLGAKTDTADGEGKVIEKKQVNLQNLEVENVQKVLKSMQGKQVQTPPIYSAIKVNGKKLYEYARENKEVEIPKREIEIYDIQLLEIKKQEATISFRVHCSKGTYIRTLCENIAEKLETVGHMKELTRLQVGNFKLEQSVTIEQIEENKDNPLFWQSHVISIQSFFEDLPELTLTQKEYVLFLNGVKLLRRREDGYYQILTHTGKWLGIGIVDNQFLKRKLIVEEME
ncbi:MAG: tRNA pseudouridine(55) synthase TruB [Intestinibacter sp.]